MAASISETFLLLLLFSIISTLLTVILSGSVVEDLNTLHPPPDFNSTIMTNCFNNPSLRYCSNAGSPMDLNEIFKFTIVASHLCNESKNPNCVESFPKIDLGSRRKIAPLYLSFSFFWKYCPLSILSIDFSNNSMQGGFPVDVLQCTQIQALDLSHNQLTGDVPVQSFSTLTSLTILNLSYNRFSESRMSDTRFFKRFNSSSFLHSGLLPDQKKFTIKAVILLVGFPIFVIVMVGWLGWLCFRRPDLLPIAFQRKHKFTPPMLKAATDGFSRKNLVGKSEGVDIYKGVLRDGSEVRIEIYWDDNKSREIRRRFSEECKVLAQLRHKNLVRVFGWCNSRRLRAIVTEWTEGENVEIWLSGSAPPLKQRLKILMGVVEGMCYLQEEWPEVGYDLRTSSIMLSEDLEPLISRFKVADQTSTTRNIYKFGVFLLEMMANRRPGDEFESGEDGYIDHIRMQYPGNLRVVIDERMKMTENSFDQAKQVIGVGLMCTDQSSSHQLHFAQISDIINRVYQSCMVLASPSHKRSRGDRGKGHKRTQSR